MPELSNLFKRFRSNRLFTDIIRSTSGRLTSALLTFIKTILLVRLIAPEIYGEIAVLFSWGYIFTAIFEFGAGSAFIAMESSQTPGEQVRHFWQFMRVRIALGLLALGMAIVVVVWLPQRYLLKGLAALVLGLGQTVCHSPEFLFQVQKRFKYYSIFIVFISGLQLFWTALAILIFHLNMCGEISLWFLLSLASWFSAMPIINLVKKSHGTWTSNIKNDLSYFSKILAFGKWVAMTGILAYTYQRWAVILLGSYGRQMDAAAYDVALNFSQILNLLVLSVVNVLSPRYASLIDFASAKRGFIKIFRFGGPVVVLFLIGYYMLGPTVVPALFGKKYTMSLVPLNALIPSYLLVLLTEPVVAFVTFGLRLPRMVFLVSLVKTAIFVLFGALIMQHYGLFGLAFFQSISRILEHVILTIIAFSLMKPVGVFSKTI
jgi:O-antigen/teichoic acid export membrane protein